MIKLRTSRVNEKVKRTSSTDPNTKHSTMAWAGSYGQSGLRSQTPQSRGESYLPMETRPFQLH